jgi:hypothetical protein
MKKLIAAIAVLAALPTGHALAADPAERTPFQVAPYAGAFVATGDQRDVLDDAVLTGLTLSYDVTPYVAVVGSFGWSPTEVKDMANGDVDLYQYDVGVQGQYAFDVGHGFTLTPFVGLGVGARTYNFRDLSVDAETDFAGYVSTGATVQYRMLAVSLTARDYVSHYDGLGLTSESTTRNDLGLFGSVGVRF